MNKLLITTILLCVSITLTAQTKVLNEGVSIIPMPNKMVVDTGEFFFFDNNKPINVFCSEEVEKDLWDMLNLKFATPTSINIVKSKNAKTSQLSFILDSNVKGGDEAYTLSISKKGIEIRSAAYGGLFYGMQTLLQLMPKEVKLPKGDENKVWAVPFVNIEDAPRFEWRGLMLDVSRHFFNKQEVMSYIDQLSEYKMNTFHWHLCDDQGWRLQIDAYPRLTEVGAWRAERVGDWWTREVQREGEKATYGGFYTKDDVKEVLEYARKRNVKVMPEIDVPGHSLEVLVAYPELACLKAPNTVNVGNKFYGIDENSLCVGNDATFEFMEKVLSEVADMFPYEYLHIGADECWKGFWKKCPKCQQRMKDEGLKDVNELQSYFVKRMETILKSKGKHLVGWDEIHEGGLAPDAVVMSWRGMQGGVLAAKQGHRVIMTPNEHCYLDLYQGEPSVEPSTYSMCRLSDSYRFEPVPDGVDPKFILGGQGNLWAESVPTFRHAEYMTWPRGWALAEVLWSNKENKNWDNFITRVERHFERAECADINYSKSMYNAIITPMSTPDSNITIVELSSELKDVDIYYTFDGTIPDHHSEKYNPLTSRLTIPLNATRLIVVTYRDGKPMGKIISMEVKDIIEKAKTNKMRAVGNI